MKTEGDFLKVDHTRITTEEFIGNSCRLEYFLDTERLHKGSNYGRIILVSPYETLAYEIVVEKDVDRDEDRRANDREFAVILRNYLKYESGRMQLDEWVTEAIRRISHLREMDEKNEAYLLVHAHICLIGGRMDDAKWLLESYNYNRFAIGKDVEMSDYYLYLTTLL